MNLSMRCAQTKVSKLGKTFPGSSWVKTPWSIHYAVSNWLFAFCQGCVLLQYTAYALPIHCNYYARCYTLRFYLLPPCREMGHLSVNGSGVRRLHFTFHFLKGVSEGDSPLAHFVRRNVRSNDRTHHFSRLRRAKRANRITPDDNHSRKGDSQRGIIIITRLH